MDDLTTGLAKAGKQPWLTRSTAVLLALVLICGGFVAGIKVQQAYGSTPTTNGANNNLANRAAGFQQNTAGQQQQQRQPVTGKVKLVDGTTVYVETADGTVVTVKTTEATIVALQAQLKDLVAGATVTVVGTGTGTVTATSIIKSN
jgi:heme A synthase